MDVATFKLRYPQFQAKDQNLVQACLNDATVQMGGSSQSGPDPYWWGGYAAAGQPLTQADQAQGALAAYLLSVSPMGNATALDGRATMDDEKNPYWRAWVRWQERVGGGVPVVAGGARGVYPYTFR